MYENEKKAAGMQVTYNKTNFRELCDSLSNKDPHLHQILRTHHYPPVWTRTASFATLVHIILEQQVSLAAAKAAFNKLKEKTGTITAKNVLALSDQEMKACYFSRQKMSYVRHLAAAILSKKLNLKKLSVCSEAEIRATLKQIKGIGDWTVDIYMLFALQHTDVFPVGDLAMVNALKEIKQLPKDSSREDIIKLAEPWRPNRSIATMLLWHHYIRTRNIHL